MENLLKEELEKLLKSFSHFFNLKIRTDRISIESIEEKFIDYKNKKTKIKDLASLILTENGKKIIIKPYEEKSESKIVKTIMEANMGYSLLENNKNNIIFGISPLTTEIKKKIINNLNEYYENSRAQIRQIRQKYKNIIKKEESSKDRKKYLEKQIEKTIEEFQNKINKLKEEGIKKI